MQAEAGALQVSALWIQNQGGPVDWAAAKKITLSTAGSAGLVIEGGNMTFMGPGTITVRSATKSFVGPATGSISHARNALVHPDSASASVR